MSRGPFDTRKDKVTSTRPNWYQKTLLGSQTLLRCPVQKIRGWEVREFSLLELVYSIWNNLEIPTSLTSRHSRSLTLQEIKLRSWLESWWYFIRKGKRSDLEESVLTRCPYGSMTRGVGNCNDLSWTSGRKVQRRR